MNKNNHSCKEIGIAFLLPEPAFARAQKRINILEKLGVRPEVLSFERGGYPGKPWENGYQCLGKVLHEKYHRRPPVFAKAVPAIRRAAERSDILYAFGQDLGLLGWVACLALKKPVPIICEIGDIADILIEDGPASSAMRLIERFLFRRIDLLVVTSEAYATEYYRKRQGLLSLPYHVVENKVDPDCPEPIDIERELKSGPLRIGCFGLIRFRRTWDMFMLLSERGAGRVCIDLRGIPLQLDTFEEDVESASRIHYGGPFRSPDDLPGMYSEVDMIWVAYSNEKMNLRWSRTNRFYQACYFQKPLIAQKGTLDGAMTESLDIGLCVDIHNQEETTERILAVTGDDLARWRENMRKIPTNIYCYDGEHEKLAKHFGQSLRKTNNSKDKL